MAVDTRNKRAGALHFPFPLPGSGIMQPDRQQITWNYPGIQAVAPPVGTSTGYIWRGAYNVWHRSSTAAATDFTMDVAGMASGSGTISIPPPV